MCGSVVCMHMGALMHGVFEHENICRSVCPKMDTVLQVRRKNVTTVGGHKLTSRLQRRLDRRLGPSPVLQPNSHSYQSGGKRTTATLKRERPRGNGDVGGCGGQQAGTAWQCCERRTWCIKCTIFLVLPACASISSPGVSRRQTHEALAFFPQLCQGQVLHPLTPTYITKHKEKPLQHAGLRKVIEQYFSLAVSGRNEPVDLLPHTPGPQS